MYVLSVPLLQIEVVNTFKSGTSFQGALRRQSSTTSQNQDVTNVSSPSHMSLSNALSSPTSTAAVPAGREWLLFVCACLRCPLGKFELHMKHTKYRWPIWNVGRDENAILHIYTRLQISTNFTSLIVIQHNIQIDLNLILVSTILC